MHPHRTLTHSLDSRTGEALASGPNASNTKRPPRADTEQKHQTQPLSSGPQAGANTSRAALDASQRRHISELFGKLGGLSHFELLGVDQTADRKTVKRAYYAQVAEYHPDSYFGRELGDIRHKMECIFQRLTEAHDTLSRKQSRAEYEAYLAALAVTRVSAQPVVDEAGLQEMERLLALAQGEGSERPIPGSEPPSQHTPIPPSLPSPPSSSSRRPAISTKLTPPLDAAARRRALARKLGRTLPPPANKPAPSEPERTRKSAEARARFRQLHEQRVAAISERRVEQYLEDARASLGANKPLGAMQALRLAATEARNQPAALATIAAMERTVGEKLAEAYTSQARYEETNGQFQQAALSYTQACAGLPDPDILKSAAECYLRAGTELRKAAELARRAVELAPERSDLRISLARVYHAAGMRQSALGELERCLQIEPESDRVKQWLKRIRSECV